jgi:hypothetical protein
LLALSACGSDDGPDRAAVAKPSPVPTVAAASLTGGTTTLEFDAAAWRVLELAGAQPRATGAAEGRGRTLRFPVTGGRLKVSPPGGAIEHAGAMRFTARGEHVRARDLIVDPDNGVVTGVVRGRRIPILVLDLDVPRELPPAGDEIVMDGRVTAFGTSAVVALGGALDVEELADGLPLGSITIVART